MLAKQAKEREQTAVDVTSALLGATVRVFAKEILRDAVGSAAPPKVKLRRDVNKTPTRSWNTPVMTRDQRLAEHIDVSSI